MFPSLTFPVHHQRHLHEKGSFVSPDSHLLFLLLIPPPEVRLQSVGPPKASPQQHPPLPPRPWGRGNQGSQGRASLTALSRAWGQ